VSSANKSYFFDGFTAPALPNARQSKGDYHPFWVIAGSSRNGGDEPSLLKDAHHCHLERAASTSAKSVRSRQYPRPCADGGIGAPPPYEPHRGRWNLGGGYQGWPRSVDEDLPPGAAGHSAASSPAEAAIHWRVPLPPHPTTLLAEARSGPRETRW
jgi:hypothetical protein